MQRYFLGDDCFTETEAHLDEESAKHALKVMRMRAGDGLIVCNMQGICYTGELTEENSPSVTLLHRERQVSELPLNVTVAQGMPKADKLEHVIQKGTELGSAAFIPFFAERSIVKIDAAKADKKTVRWQKIAKEAAEQSHRQRCPVVEPPVSFQFILKKAAEFDHVIVAYEEEAKAGETSLFSQAVNRMNPKEKVLLIVGPEGGLTEEETGQLIKAGGVSCGFGPRILRTETASLFALAVFSYHFELSR
ncbi:16S rRNA (uracil(1498)-N(3))-methyltransferase [Alkalicoccus halolimnae]|uniref:Ribosomal RNA small subunit methyltransferase E n=1 Tax=Alkalicoccus halolimnae TaxID=1667239 RepID=A0A5C7FJY9_9BACI|nr:16S rRNA (uracil(1498)-N(3))-methyltransferase [Alkalicoccus halolimnae]TXF86449.1 16S rRNA (uracil(1498)-N(3))-methyltransferase [Alkalicoccus halolimnae]